MPLLGKNFRKNKGKKEKVKAEKNKNGVPSPSFGRTDTKVNTRSKEILNRGGKVILLRSVFEIYILMLWLVLYTIALQFLPLLSECIKIILIGDFMFKFFILTIFICGLNIEVP